MLLQRGSVGPQVRDLQQRLAALGYRPGRADGVFGPLTETAVRELQRDGGLLADGIVGPRTRSLLETPQCLDSTRPRQPEPARPPHQAVATAAGEPRWLAIARREMGTRRADAGQPATPRIVEYHQATSLRAQSDRTPWCASFLSWVLEQAGVRSTRSARAKSYLDWGSALSVPELGAIVVFHRGTGPPSSEGSGHVGLYVEDRGTSIGLLGGNQGSRREVSITSYPKSRLLGYRWPPGH